jgi:tetratricopeptide (TPR) repeat protein
VLEMPRFRLLALWVALPMVLTWPASVRAQAQPPAGATDAAARARDHASKGRRLYDLRRYDPAIREFEQAYQLDNDPAHLYNIAQSHRLANHVPEAIAAYRAYLDRLPEAANRPDVERRIAELGAAQRPPNSLDPQPPANFPPAAPAPGSWPPPQTTPAAGGAAPLLGDPGSAATAAPPGAPYYYPPATPAVAAVVPPPGQHRHDGFFLRVQLGFGFTSVTSERTDTQVSGGSGHFALAAGAALAGKLALFAELGGGSVTEPRVKIGDQSTPFQGELTVVTFGVGAAYYFMPINIYLSGTIGGSQVTMKVQDRMFESKTGFGVTLSAGKEWWVSKDLGLGAAVQLHSSAVKEKVPLNPDTLTPAWISLAFSGTYN